MRGALLAVKPGGHGRTPPSSDIVWKYNRARPTRPAPWSGTSCCSRVTDDGIARAFDACSGKLHWTERLKGDYKASPLAAEGRVYFLNTDGLCTVVSAETAFEKLAENQLATTRWPRRPRSGGQLFIRGRAALYCMGDKAIGDASMTRIVWLTDIHLNFLPDAQGRGSFWRRSPRRGPTPC